MLRPLLSLLLLLHVVAAGFLSVNMTQATECGTSLVQWSGDDGPYHLLLTPTKIVQHGYNVWVDSIPAGTNEYSLYIRQPEGLQFILTVWGASGITYAATTDVMTVGPAAAGTKSCFMTDAQILSLYSFSFNLTTADGSDYPPQCSNISVSWPTSLESNVTSDVAKRIYVDGLPEGLEIDIDLDKFAASSSEHSGNTTAPPTLFGVIPLGNSFSIPITFPRNSSFASHLPESSLSDNPTTYTSHGTTHLNWTVDMAKGTRFILVAGIGSAEQWASGGSSRMFTVGQGTMGCVGSESDGSGAPSVTGSRSTATATATLPVSEDSESNPVVRTVVAVVCSVLGTLVLVGLLFICRRARNRRRAQEATISAGTSAVAGAGGGWGMFTKRGGSPKAVTRHSPSETQLDLIASRDSHRDQSQDNLSRRDQQHEREIAPLVMNNTRNHSVSPPTDSPLDNNMDPFRDREPVKLGYTYPYSSGSQTYSTGRSDSGFTSFGAGTSFNGVQSSATTATDRRGGVRGDSQASMGTGRQPSLDALLTHSNGEYYDMPFFPAGASVSAHDYTPNPTYTATTSNMSYYLPRSRTPGPLVLHDPTSRSVDLSAEGSDGDTEGRAREFRHGSGERASEDIADLKRETLAISSPSPSSPNTSFTSPSSTTMTRSLPPLATSGPGRRRRQPREQEMGYMVHRDAGRVPVASRTGAEVLELPPRYEEVNWSEEERREREDRERGREQEEGSGREER
ncbi:hypothetical protein C349_00690 [Cryptococcus neoformans var. grubii Br795]|uniref:Uncharacterized protein n=1 Tax=Cryptococcus neoformans Tu259-1 TaxID=1230072 RepID=A0A854QM05_CRYNE|nr:hypothetical protein C353_00719 [Cryptococcus neoformans var. grubii AD1-83a]OWZ58053.1 hypothetical protein C368_01226 [Cryptococcus neoformans var. grubii 125.91]OWZ80877.1 hypothetical protein C365_00703 [Cryptococcus neoformans var. grubii Bt85]OXG29058.1 hypothetical protein C361_00713 [Cryptococcus neoformans var. grubii Tu259-1]OXG40978.1 hypothetical protein C360_00762 [Cryptococcus neoformans var. grubii Bt15]OXG54310.1 hypothetical protein C355_00709 [Cryptococcus neoformans var. 